MSEPSHTPSIDAGLDFHDMSRPQRVPQEIEGAANLRTDHVEPYPEDMQLAFLGGNLDSTAFANLCAANDASNQCFDEHMRDGTLQGSGYYQQIESQNEPILPTSALPSSNEYSMENLSRLRSSICGPHSALSSCMGSFDILRDKSELNYDSFGQPDMINEDAIVSHVDCLPNSSGKITVSNDFEPCGSSLKRRRSISDWEEDDYSSASTYQKPDDLDSFNNRVSEYPFTSFPHDLSPSHSSHMDLQSSEAFENSVQAVNHTSTNASTNLMTSSQYPSSSGPEDYWRLHQKAYPPELGFKSTEYERSYNGAPASNRVVVHQDHGSRIGSVREQGVKTQEITGLQPVVHLGERNTFSNGKLAPSIVADKSPFDLSLFHMVCIATQC